MVSLRAILLWFMMLAIPFQGYAAVAMLLCAPGPAHSAIGAVHDHSRHDHGAAGAQHHHARVGGDDGANRHDVLSAQDDPSDASPHKCGNCAACHSVGMMPTLGTAILHGPPQADFAEPLGAVATVSLNVPHKPPRV
jgi:hypothetical protein